MAELLIKLIDHIHSDPVKDRSGAYKRGDVVVVMPDGHEWGREEGPPKFGIIKVVGLSVMKCQEFVRPEMQDEVFDGQTIRGQKTRRLHRIDIDSLPPALQELLPKPAGITVAWQVLRDRIVNKTTGTNQGQRKETDLPDDLVEYE